VATAPAPSTSSPLFSGGLATGAAGVSLLAVGLAGFGYQAFVVQPSMQQYVVAIRNDNGRSIAVVTDDHAYQELLDLSRNLFWVATAVSTVGGTLTALGAALATVPLFVDAGGDAPPD
jgi:hypothetical protein